ncbi:Protein of unknown function DUF473 [Methanococcus vannielii SB]|jgi:hypothetical protein|uniref:Uncharacterized protein n=1 Tax=Methanococcus vannielii (strain ATCC 35089 / DSM 1224 / JCM 13029 / OCM 148 / SB) TaxID=406327 RepID=A6UN51_METVS|nr:DUF473 family protein [Methanococcus vannielii]ABR53923.1 Protein of unknown function DUF473 [Methanococcus vannielii SB]
MKVLALTGVAPYAISEIVKNHVKTLNLKNFSNLVVVESSTVGDILFVTNTLKDDVISSTEGLIVQIKKIEITNQIKNSKVTEESEIIVSKVQVELLGYASCLKVLKTELMDPLLVILKIKSLYEL